MSSLHSPASPLLPPGAPLLSSSPSPSLKDTNSVPLVKKVVFSGLSGAIATTCVYPIAITKTRLQAEASRVRSSPSSLARLIWREGGVIGFYRGWPPNVLFVMPEKAIKLTANDYFQSLFRRGGRSDLSVWQEASAGGLAGLCQVIATTPMELLQIQGATMAEKVKKGELKGRISYPTLIRQLGLSGLYCGLFSTLIRDIPFSTLYFSLYSELKRRLLHDATTHLGFKSFLAGAVAGTVAAGMTCPMDVVKTRVQAAAVPCRGLSVGQFVLREVGMWRFHFHQLMSSEGFVGLFRGVLPRCVIISPLFGITMTCYEEFQQLWG